jgi:DNA modification methylase
MPFTYHPPTRQHCHTCEQLSLQTSIPLMSSQNVKASSANNFPFHNWYNFVLGYSPEFPEYLLSLEGVSNNELVADPFMGSGTTLISCKQRGIPSKGIDANDFMVDAARVKLNWNLDIAEFYDQSDRILRHVRERKQAYDWELVTTLKVMPTGLAEVPHLPSFERLLENRRPEMLKEKYISSRPLAKALIIKDAIEAIVGDGEFREIFDLALSSLLVPISNIRYGPGFGVAKPRLDSDVDGSFAKKLQQMARDLSGIQESQRKTVAEVCLGDSRILSKYWDNESIDLIITSPPYPGDHEYTKHTRLELIFQNYAQNLAEFQTIKRRMLSASTTNIYRDQDDSHHVAHIQSINEIVEIIQERLESDGATSGFEKLYTRLVQQYFGGMFKTLEQCFRVLRNGGKVALLVSDSHAFKMVHIQTAQILQEIAEEIGFRDSCILLWQLKASTSHSYDLRENILILRKPL